MVSILLFLTGIVLAGDSDQRSPKPFMQKMLDEIAALRPYMLNATKFLDSKNQGEISLHLKTLADLTQGQSHNPSFGSPVYRPSWDVLRDHISETHRVFMAGNKEYARWMLQSTLNICMSCHSQMQSGSRGWKPVDLNESFLLPFEQAEFFYATRAFDKAHELYQKTIFSFPKQETSIMQLETALEREAAYYARTKRDPKGAVEVFSKYLKIKNLPEYLEKNLKAWVSDFKAWRKTPNPGSASAKEIEDFITSEIAPNKETIDSDNERAVVYLKVSGVLYEYLGGHPNSELAPTVLYWLAVCDRRLSHNFFFSLADIYLKDCITKYSRDPIAKKCYQEYEDNTIASFSGSSGTHLPSDVQDELRHLKTLVEKQ